LLTDDPVVKRAVSTALMVAEKYGVEVLSVVIYGSRAKGDFSFTSDYDCFVLLGDRTTLLQYTQLHSELRMVVYQIGNVKIYLNTIQNFTKILQDNPFLGAFCYIIASEGVPVYDPDGKFRSVQEEVRGLPPEEKVKHVKRCIAMSESLQSPKWVDYWRRELKKLSRTPR
jgi:predicted nucleotidyltransferase